MIGRMANGSRDYSRQAVACGRWTKTAKHTYVRVTGETIWGANGRWYADSMAGNCFTALHAAMSFVDHKYRGL